MSKDEEREKLGRVTLEHAELRRHIALLEDDLRKAGRLLESVGTVMRMDPMRIVNRLQELPDKGELLASAEKLLQAKVRFEELTSVLRTYGLTK